MKELIEEASEEYAYDYFDMHEINHFKALKQGFEAGANYIQKQMFSEADMIDFAEFVASYPDKNRNYKGEILHAKSKYDGAERTIDLLEIWLKESKIK